MPRPDPPSIENIANSLKAKQESDSKPKFMSRKEREERDRLEQLEAEEREKKEMEEAERRAKVEEREERLRSKIEYEKRKALERSERDSKRSRYGDDSRRGEKRKASVDDEVLERKQQIDETKKRLLGIKNEKPKIRRRRDKFDANWDPSEDTSESCYRIIKDKANNSLSIKSKFTKDDDVANKTVEKPIGKKTLHEMTTRDWRIFKDDHEIRTTGGNIPNPLRSWEEANISLNLLEIIYEVGYKNPTPIQRQAIPVGLQNRDIIGVAETGSGKTAAYLIPLLSWIESIPRDELDSGADLGPLAIILVPTRELSEQVTGEIKKCARSLGVRALSIIGGKSKEFQASEISAGCEIIVGTPGRLIDLLEDQLLCLERCSYVVIDEADRMIEDKSDFEAQLKKIYEYLPKTNEKADNETAEDLEMLQSNFNSVNKLRQTVMFTATMSGPIERVAKTYMRKPVTVQIGTPGQPIERIEQKVFIISEQEKWNKLLSFLGYDFKPPVIIFVNTKHTVDYLVRGLESMDYKVTSMHGNKSQDLREKALEGLKNGTKHILVATNVAARGIDIKDVTMVINYDMTKEIDEYVHRVGRTGRAGKSGVAVTFLTNEDSPVFYDLKLKLQQSKVSKCPDELARHPEAQVKPGTVLQKKRRDEVIHHG